MCGIPSVQGAMNGTHISIVKPQGAFVEEYYYHKIGLTSWHNLSLIVINFLWAL